MKKALGDQFQYTDTELKKVLQNLHRHRRDAYTVSLNSLKSKANKQRIGINSRRKDVSICLVFLLLYHFCDFQCIVVACPEDLENVFCVRQVRIDVLHLLKKFNR
jgi:hypothetical protein